jgi:hypothetical protein
MARVVPPQRQRRRWEGALPATVNPNLRFGVFMAPLHHPGRSPNVNLHRDLELVEKLATGVVSLP